MTGVDLGRPKFKNDLTGGAPKRKKRVAKKKPTTASAAAKPKKATKPKRKPTSWNKAVSAARKELGIVGMCLINKGVEGKKLYQLALKKHAAMKK